mmetsp:Transcript_22905/g.50603  ORF Transcript_22905/g.50603 Transcript_22905/m.50603 type:complete len:104 (+) Transcript_22905:3-314(+)
MSIPQSHMLLAYLWLFMIMLGSFIPTLLPLALLVATIHTCAFHFESAYTAYHDNSNPRLPSSCTGIALCCLALLQLCLDAPFRQSAASSAAVSEVEQGQLVPQ